jgi:hypothetical protein
MACALASEGWERLRAGGGDLRWLVLRRVTPVMKVGGAPGLGAVRVPLEVIRVELIRADGRGLQWVSATLVWGFGVGGAGGGPVCGLGPVVVKRR